MKILLYNNTSALLSLHAANSYILFTANLEDFQAIAKHIAASPVGTQLNKIIRRASTLFNRQLNAPDKPHKRSDGKLDDDKSFEVWKPDGLESIRESASDSDSLSDKDEEYLKERDGNLVERRTNTAEGKNVSYYLQSIKKIFENI